MRNRRAPEEQPVCIALYKAGKAVPVLALIAFLLYHTGVLEGLYSGGCAFKRATGLYCPGCGGTRALCFMLSGELLKSLYYHPSVLYFTVFYIVFMLKAFINRHCHAGTLSDRRAAVFILAGAGLTLLQWIVKLILLLHLNA